MPELHSLRHLNSFGIEIGARQISRPENLEELREVLESQLNARHPLLVLGEGSNILFTKDFDGLVLQAGFSGVYVVEEDASQVLVKVGAGENWDQWVATSLERGWYGLENLSLIPGTVGAAPVQNIGAYGVEFKDHVRRIHAWDLQENKAVELCHKNCHFSYRNSIFKSSQKGRYIITHVCFRLSKKPELKLAYGNIEETFRTSGGSTAMDLRKVVIQTRRDKLPDPEEYGNAGSFFKNPVIEAGQFKKMQASHPELPHYPAREGWVKIPAAWLIDRAGWKGKRQGNVGTWPTQPLVLVNYGGATGYELIDFARNIMEDVRHKFDIVLEPEVNVM